jgi:hypothetical protein
VNLAASGALEKLELGGTLSLAPKDWRADLRLDSSGMDATQLGSYLPSGLAADLHGGSLRLHLDAAAKANPEGGAGAHVLLDEFAFDTGDAAQPPFKLGSLALRIARADPEKRVFAIDEISLTGVECSVRRDLEDKLHVLGLSLGAARNPATSANAEPNGAPSTPAAAQPSSAAVTRTATPVTAQSAPPVATGTEAPRATMTPPPIFSMPESFPSVSLAKLDVGIEKLTFIDEKHGPGAVPLVASVRVTTDKPTVLLGPNPGALQPLHFDVQAAVEPIVKTIDVAVEMQPYEDEPMVSLALRAHGVRGEGLTEAAPDLASRIDGRELTEGEIQAKARLRL